MKGPGSPTEVLRFCEAAMRDYMSRSQFTLALEMLVQHYQDLILRYCHCHVLDPEVAREVAQEVFLAAFEGLPGFRGHASIKTWLYSIALKKCLEAWRNMARRDALAHDHQRLILQRAHRDPPAQPEETCSQAMQRQLVWQALHRLRDQERELVVLRYLEDLTYDEMAQILKVSKRTIERRLPLAQAKFHTAYETCQRKVIANKRSTASRVKESQ
jgi:RNA polymerase sigma-70 factor, ECF subfamily